MHRLRRRPALTSAVPVREGPPPPGGGPFRLGRCGACVPGAAACLLRACCRRLAGWLAGWLAAYCLRLLADQRADQHNRQEQQQGAGHDTHTSLRVHGQRAYSRACRSRSPGPPVQEGGAAGGPAGRAADARRTRAGQGPDEGGEPTAECEALRAVRTVRPRPASGNGRAAGEVPRTGELRLVGAPPAPGHTPSIEPPVASSVWPVTQRASSEATKATTSAMSAASPTRPKTE